MRRESRFPADRRESGRNGIEREIPLDLVGVGAVLAATFLSLSLGAGSFVRVVASVVTLCVLPGYVTVALLFPHVGGEGTSRGSGSKTRISLRERGALSFGLSVALVPLVALLGSAAGWLSQGFTARGTFALIGAYVAVVGLLAAYRRLRLPVAERFFLPIGAWTSELLDGVSTGSRAERALTIGLVCSILLAIGAFGFAAATPVQGETYTDFHLLTTDESGEYVSSGYPDSLTRGESTELSWGIRSYEAEPVDYTVVATLERVVETDGSLTRTETAELYRANATLAPGDHEIVDHEIAPPLVGEDLRIAYYLYRGDAPETPSEETAYRHLRVWVDVGVNA
ncbi:DUF1616 domain-containing protein [Halorubrum trueperi]|uniref:DUF1616 domain-containing protein n=1 Tax=Halorubrum trueperi TaxID=2004704 RepID=A0ABD5UJF3_9EURY